MLAPIACFVDPLSLSMSAQQLPPLGLYMLRYLLVFLLLLDVDECSVGTYCDQICVNTIGSAHCICEEGYAFLEDKVTCEGMTTSQ